jgi:hypothetical protein
VGAAPKFAEQQGKTNDNLVARQSQLQALQASPGAKSPCLSAHPGGFLGAQDFVITPVITTTNSNQS